MFTFFRMKFALNVNRGLFECRDVLGTNEYKVMKDYMEELRENGQFLERPHGEDDGIVDHPEWVEHFDHKIQDQLHDYINTTDIPMLFGFQDNSIPIDHLSTSFLLRYRRRRENAKRRLRCRFSVHKDQSKLDGVHVLSVIFTIKDQSCIGGVLEYANTPDGNVAETKNMLAFLPRDNSIYCLNGDFVAHCAYDVTGGERFAVVLFYNTPQSKVDVVALWNPKLPKEYICRTCYHAYKTPKQFQAHRHRLCRYCGEYVASIAKLLKHEPICEEEMKELQTFREKK